ncbi:hypothetical protein F5Y09DRAFT_349709 [Xylaria sp. FL1042]|nr:hypothetical protein F5Y09DRAFT_349709 [Xylaria sp. FL1042]
MPFQGEPQGPDIQKYTDSATESYCESLVNFSRQTPLSLDIQPAEDVPPIRQGGDPEQDKDEVTGRMISKHGSPCLRCEEKGLRCTLTFVAKESEVQCAACRRSRAPYCIRYHPLGQSNDGKGIPYFGPPWKNPNYIAGRSADGEVAELPPDQLEEILREFYEGPSGYLLGHYLTASDVSKFALPPFNGADLPPEARPENYKTMDWRDVLPIWKNRCLNPAETEEDQDPDKQKKILEISRELMFLPLQPRWEIATMMAENSKLDENSFRRVLRKYQPLDKSFDGWPPARQ